MTSSKVNSKQIVTLGELENLFKLTFDMDIALVNYLDFWFDVN